MRNKESQRGHPPPGLLPDALSRVRPVPATFPEPGSGPLESDPAGKDGAVAVIPSSGAVWLEKALPEAGPRMPPSQRETACLGLLRNKQYPGQL